jgi:hypothetical protein
MDLFDQETFDNTTGSLEYATHPSTQRAFRVPGFRCLWKIHKEKIDTRPVTGNCCWILHPLSDLADYYLLGHARKCIDYCQDVDFTISGLQSIKATESDLLVGYDWANLYPSFSHDDAESTVKFFKSVVLSNFPSIPVVEEPEPTLFAPSPKSRLR